ncbi:glucosaminyl-phosphotidylinositol O-acyltransferase SCDLUD_003675 [Saccharomycodes ludwigii]|uniref:glucosaminyl-phosphotidylinositol O-acyltransferase n=1 Tax=Saccharomycodes ludwigii TaxID=36035 RepID=UPI001E85EED6|nr:hypothetical protein SCDLUD_003675 [Saccharomycodes ludwigii]KAH3900676.1 hypothetical protein SCDLUD_003675 [Saccharomycodes ludwigii]
MATLKERKELFVTGLSGGTISEINYVTSIALTTYLCSQLILNSSSYGKITVLIIDFLLNWAAVLLSITTYSDSPIFLNILILLPTIVYKLLTANSNNSEKPLPNHNKHKQKDFKLTKKSFITGYRGTMLVLTSIAILAVDFQIFPRRFAKVETWGTSLMDLGVGSFVFSNGVVSARSYFKKQIKEKNLEKIGNANKPKLFSEVLASLKSGAVLLLLGLLRLFFVKNLEYQEHVTEYGVHWNFFITLSLLPPFLVLFVDPILQVAPIPRFFVALIISLSFELFLIFDESFLKYLVLSPRYDFLSSNREGLASFLGYSSIFLWGQTIGGFLLGNRPTLKNLYKISIETPTTARDQKRWDTVTPLKGLITWFVILLTLSKLVFEVDPYDVSRRFANLPYVLWVVTYNIGFLLCYCLIDSIVLKNEDNYKVPLTLESMNSNGLIMFLVANVSTGLCNMCINTLDKTTIQALTILLIYCLFVCSIGLLLFINRIFIKL